MKKATLVIGASENPERYSNRAILSLLSHGHEVKAIGGREGEVSGIEIWRGLPKIENIDTVTVYLNANNQKGYYNYLLSLQPRRVIFNPGAENTELASLLEKNGIEPIEACTLVMLSTGSF